MLIKSDLARIAEEIRLCVENIRRRYEKLDDSNDWYVAAGMPVSRLSTPPACFDEANRILSYRHLCIG